MSASISTGPETSPDPSVAGTGDGWLEARLQRIDPVWVSVALFVLALVVYVGSNASRPDFYDHFVWQADAFLHGRAEIAYPVTEGPYQNGYFQDVLPVGPDRAQIPFPPLPAIVLLPFVAVWGLGTNGAAVAAVLGAVNVVLCWIMLLGVTPRRSAALLGTLFYGFGTVAWYAAMLGTTWFLAHVVASTFLLVSIAIAVRADEAGRRPRSKAGRRALGRQFAAGLALGAAATARLTTIFGAPFFVFVGGGGRWAGVRSVPESGRSSRSCSCSATTWPPRASSSTPPTTTSTRSSTGHSPGWSTPTGPSRTHATSPRTSASCSVRCRSRRYSTIPPAVCEELGPGSLFDRECPLLRPDPAGHEHPAHEPGLPAHAARVAA